MCSIGNTGLRVTLHCIQTESRSYMVFRVTSSVAGGGRGARGALLFLAFRWI